MVQLGYRVVESFSPDSKESWEKYIQWSGLVHLTEVVGLDCSLSPSVLGKLEDEDWNHLVFGEELGDCLDDLAYLRRRVAGVFDRKRHQILAVAREPSERDVEQAGLLGFRFMGFELIEEASGTSALTNCGGFEGAFDPSDLSKSGLVSSAARAYNIRDALLKLFPKEHHAECTVWALWRLETA